MDFLDLYYRSVKEFSDKTHFDKDNLKSLKTISHSSSDKDRIETKRAKCIIEEDWIVAIEKGLPYIKKAIDEGRQFIANEGNVVPIEKIKRVSKASTVHLAKHSNLITRLPENESENIIPDKLFMEEKLNEFAVYENRFLYMLLVYLRDFVDIRAEKIEELGRSYFSDFSINKNVKFNKRYLNCEIKFSEQNYNYIENFSDEKTKGLMNRIEDIQHLVLSYLSTELMETVSKVAMIKPPIIKTNVLKMDVNFKNAVALYEFLSEYNKDGYAIEEIKTTIKPFSEELAFTVGDIVNMFSYLSYSYGGGMYEKLREKYLFDEEKNKKEKEESVKREIERLKKQANKSGKTLEEYLYLLEKRNEALQRDSDLLKASVIREKKLTESLNNLESKNKVLKENIVTLEADNEKTKTLLEETIENSEKKIEKISLELNEKLVEQQKQSDELYEKMEKNLLNLNSELNEEIVFLKARINGMLKKYGEICEGTDDYSSKESFLLLEKEYYAFVSFFEEKWKEVKKKIKVKHLGKKIVKSENLRKENKDNEEE